MLRPGLDVDRAASTRFRPFLSVSVIFQSTSSSATRSPLIEIDLLVAAGDAAEQLAGRRAVQHDAERVVAVGRERVSRAPGRRACPTACRRRAASATPCADLDGELRRAGVAVADRERRDLRGGAQVAFHQRRRERLDIGDVVVAGAQRVGRQERVDVDVEVEQIVTTRAYSARFRRWNGRRPGFGRSGAAPSILFSSDVTNCVEHRGVGPARAGRRHHAEPQLMDDLFGDFGVSARACAGSNSTSDSPPALPFSLWQPMQYCLVRSRSRRRRRPRGAGAAALCATAIAGFLAAALSGAGLRRRRLSGQIRGRRATISATRAAPAAVNYLHAWFPNRRLFLGVNQSSVYGRYSPEVACLLHFIVFLSAFVLFRIHRRRLLRVACQEMLALARDTAAARIQASPFAGALGRASAFVEARTSRVPELDRRGDNPIAAPEQRAGNGNAGKARSISANASSRAARGESLLCRRRPRADLGAARPRREVGIGFGVRDPFDASLDTHLGLGGQ